MQAIVTAAIATSVPLVLGDLGSVGVRAGEPALSADDSQPASAG